MNRIISAIIAASALIFGVFMPGEKAVAQTANELVGTWTLVSSTLEKDGKTTDFYGPNPKGQLMYDPNGHFSVIITRSDLPKFASNNREAGTPEENKAVVQGSFAYFRADFTDNGQHVPVLALIPVSMQVGSFKVKKIALPTGFAVVRMM